MKIKLSELRNEFYEYSKKTSELFRNLSLAGIAIIWIFKKDSIAASEYIINLPIELLLGLKYFISALAIDFLHAFVPSIILGIRSELEDFKKTNDQKEIELSFNWAFPTWIFFLAKISLMFYGFFSIYCWLFN